MNPYQYECICSVCGGRGLGHVRYTGGEWLGGTFTHTNPMVCKENIAVRKRREEEKYTQSQVVAEGAGI